MIPQGSGEYCNRIAMICWALWSNRNNLIWNELKLTPIQFVENACFILQQWKDAHSSNGDVVNSRVVELDGRSHNVIGLNAMLMPLLLKVYHSLGLVLFFEILMGSSSL